MHRLEVIYARPERKRTNNRSRSWKENRTCPREGPKVSCNTAHRMMSHTLPSATYGKANSRSVIAGCTRKVITTSTMTRRGALPNMTVRLNAKIERERDRRTDYGACKQE